MEILQGIYFSFASSTWKLIWGGSWLLFHTLLRHMTACLDW